jgi:hypothetical protein
MKKLIFIICVIATLIGNTGFAWTRLSEEAEDAAVKAIQANDLQKLKAVVGSKTITSKLVDASVGTSDVSGYACHTDIVKYLMDDTGKKMWAGTIVDAAMSGCPEIVKLLVPKSSPGEIAQAAMQFDLINFKNSLDRAAADPLTNQKFSSDKIISRVGDTALVLIDENKKLCKAKDPLNKNCAALDHMKSNANEIEKREKDQQLLNSPDGTVAQACEVLAEIKSSQQTIQEQKNIGKISGVVNKSVLYQAGGEINASNKELSALKAKYHSQTGNPLDLGRCGR